MTLDLLYMVMGFTWYNTGIIRFALGYSGRISFVLLCFVLVWLRRLDGNRRPGKRVLYIDS